MAYQMITPEAEAEVLRRIELRKQLRRDARQYSVTGLCEKFEISHVTLGKIIHDGWARGGDEDEAELIRQCASEYARLVEEAKQHSYAQIASDLGTSENLVRNIATNRRLAKSRTPTRRELAAALQHTLDVLDGKLAYDNRMNVVRDLLVQWDNRLDRPEIPHD